MLNIHSKNQEEERRLGREGRSRASEWSPGFQSINHPSLGPSKYGMIENKIKGACGSMALNLDYTLESPGEL